MARLNSHCVGMTRKGCKKSPTCTRTRKTAKRRSYCRINKKRGTRGKSGKNSPKRNKNRFAALSFS